MNNSKQKPWLNYKGQFKSDEELKEACKDWGPSVWEEYLSTIDVSQKEDSVASMEVFDSLSGDERTNLIFSLAGEEKYAVYKAAIQSYVRLLPPRQRYTIERYYWDGKSIVEIAKESGVSKQAVQKSMKAAMARLRNELNGEAIKQKIRALKELLAA